MRQQIIRSLQRLEYTGMDDDLTRDNFRNDAAIDVNQIKRTIRKKTTREALIDARLGQGKFRAEVGDRWDNVCAVTGCGIIELLRASHIKPWRASTNPERLDPENGLLLAAHADALFDRGLITFAAMGPFVLASDWTLQSARGSTYRRSFGADRLKRKQSFSITIDVASLITSRRI